jgi:hypothetical protein
MTAYHLFLDDERNPGDVTWCNLPSARYTVVRNFDDFVRHVVSFGVTGLAVMALHRGYRSLHTTVKMLESKRYEDPNKD